jgi:hypothetical protein
MHDTGEYSISDLAKLFSVSRPNLYRTLGRGQASVATSELDIGRKDDRQGDERRGLGSQRRQWSKDFRLASTIPDALNLPAYLAFTPVIENKTVIDLGCGEGSTPFRTTRRADDRHRSI